jgi:DNA mismatch repair protein MutS
VKEWKGSVVFLHEVAEGAAKRSWGVHVAELAGVPASVVRRAAALMNALERHGNGFGAAASVNSLPLFAAGMPGEEPRPVADPKPLLEALKECDPDKMSPREALDTLYRLKALTSLCERRPA